MKNSVFIIAVRGLLATIFLSVLVGFYIVQKQGFMIDSDLASLAPDLTLSTDVKNALNSFSVVAQKKIQIVVAANSEALAEDLAFWLEDYVESKDLAFRLESNDILFERYLSALKDYPFNFLTHESLNEINALSPEALINKAQVNLFQFNTQRIIPFSLDPMGYLNNYAFARLEALAAESSTVSMSAIDVENDDEGKHYSLISLQLIVNALDVQAQQRVMTELNDMEAALRNTFGIESDPLAAIGEQQVDRAELYFSGILFFAQEAAASAKRDISVIGIGSSLGIVLLIFLIFRGLSPLVLPLVSIALGVFCAFVICHLVFGRLNVLAIVFGASLIGVAVDYALHYYYCALKWVGTEYDINRAKSQSLSSLYRALLLSLVTSIIGYLALGLSGLVALQQIALFSIVGLLVAWLAVLGLGELFVRKAKPIFNDQWLVAFVQWGLRLSQYLIKSRSIVFFTVSFFILGGFAVSKVTFTDSPRAFFIPSEERIKIEALAQSLSHAVEPASYFVVHGQSEGEVFDVISALRKKALTANVHLMGVDDFFSGPRAQTTAYQANLKLYGANGAGLDFLDNSGAQVEQREFIASHYISSNNMILSAIDFFEPNTLPQLIFSGEHAVYAIMLIKRGVIPESLKTIARDFEQVTYINTIDSTASRLTHLRESAQLFLLLAFIFIAILIALRYKKIRASGIVLIPFISVLLSVSVLILFNVPISLFHIMALFLVLGLGMDYVIFTYEMPAKPVSTLCAILLSGLTSLMSFGLLSLSAMPIVAAFGLTVLLGNTFNLLGCFTLASRRST